MKPYVFLFLVALCWGPSYMFIKFASEGFGPIMISATRVLIGSILLLGVFYLRGRRWSDYKHLWKHFLFMGLFMNAIPFTLINLGERYISSGLAAILIAMTPIVTSLLAHFFIETEKINLFQGIGILVAFSGVAFVYLPYIFDEIEWNAFGILFVLGAAVSYAIGTTFARRYLQKLPPLVGPLAQLIMATIVLIPFALLFDFPKTFSFPPFAGIMALGFLGTALAFYLYYELIRMKGATFASLNAMIAPIIAVFLGWIFLNESLGWNVYVGGAMILLGLGITNPYISWKNQSHQ